MVSVSVPKRSERRSRDPAAVLEILRSITPRVLEPDTSVIDRLFALECAARAGKRGRALVEALKEVERQARWDVTDRWEINVPRTAELGQLISTSIALDLDIDRKWIILLVEAVETLSKRTSRLNLGSDPVLLASVVRGLAASGEPIPEPILEAADQALHRQLTVEQAAELGEALVRHQGAQALARTAASYAYERGTSLGCDSAYALWWLDQRWQDMRRTSCPVDPVAVDDARADALSCADFHDLRVAAMAFEVVGLAAENLVVASPEQIADDRTIRDRWRESEVIWWRAFVAVAASVLGFTHLPSVVQAIFHRFHTGQPPVALYQGTAGLLAAIVAIATLMAIRAYLRVWWKLEIPGFEWVLGILITVAVALFGLVLYPS